MQRTKKKVNKPLALDRESIRLLASRDLANAHGGAESGDKMCPAPQIGVTDKSMISDCATCTSC